MREIPNILRAVCSTPWVIQEEKLVLIMEFLQLRASGNPSSEEFTPRVGPSANLASGAGGVQVINVFGTISQRMGMMEAASGGVSTEAIGKAFDAAMQSPEVRDIVLNFDSPGGSVFGIQELGDKILSARGQGKKIVGQVNSEAGSGAYWLASCCEEIVCTPGGQVGSIGCLMTHTDRSKMNETVGVKTTYIRAGKYKVEGNPNEPLSTEAETYAQSLVDAYYGKFVGAVAKGRGVTPAKVRSDYGQGRMLIADAALSAGMVDRIGTLADTLQRLSVPQARSMIGRMRAELLRRELDCRRN